MGAKGHGVDVRWNNISHDQMNIASYILLKRYNYNAQVYIDLLYGLCNKYIFFRFVSTVHIFFKAYMYHSVLEVFPHHIQTIITRTLFEHRIKYLKPAKLLDTIIHTYDHDKGSTSWNPCETLDRRTSILLK